ncbi:hypothetical protein OG225_06695 [Nocardia sp. NBC_01377]|uniref:hypothetical protein n=1 Tax=Nocardia sp. NBC_01377 TaxID=2903595 RepID=UPI0032529EEA
MDHDQSRHDDPDDLRHLDAILTASPELQSLTSHVRAFAVMMTELKGEQLEQWMRCVDADDQPALHSFVVACAAIRTRLPQA